MKHVRIGYETKRKWMGLVFVAPWIVGFLFFFARPLANSLYFTLNSMKLTQTGYQLTWLGIGNFRRLFAQDPEFIRLFVAALRDVLYNVPIIVLFGLFVASLLNQRFRGRTFARALFFLPAVISSGVVVSVIRQDVLAGSIGVLGQANVTYLFEASAFQKMLRQSGLNTELIGIINDIVSRTFELTWKSGIQILLFLAGLQSISRSLYEAANVDGATGWDKFWKITLPMIMPVIIVNVVYTVVDTFSNFDNPFLRYIHNAAFVLGDFTYSAAMSWIYFLVNFGVLGIITYLLSRRTFYLVE